MNIAIDLTSLDDNFTGIERYALNMALELVKERPEKQEPEIQESEKQEPSGSFIRAMSESDCHDTFELIFKNKVFPAFQPFEGKETIHFHILPGCGKLAFNQLRLPHYLNRIKADYYLFFAFPMPILLHKKHVLSAIHDLGCWDCPGTMKKQMVWYFRLSYRWAVRRAERTITVSEFSKGRIQQILHVPEEKILVTYNGVCGKFLTDDLAAQNRARLRQKYHLPDKYLLCLSTLEPRKNMTLLLNAYLDLYRQGKIQTKLVLAGRKGWKIDEFLREAKETAADSEIAAAAGNAKDSAPAADTDFVTVTGFIDDDDLPEVYRMANCFVFPSIYEGFGIPPLEAMSQGVPVISSDAASMPEVLGDAPLYFKSGDKEDLKRAILEMENFTEKERAERAAAGLLQSRKFRYEKEAAKVREYLHGKQSG
ncbi:MAG: glycosyltransferase family 4 protein [Clostridiales bacterium]|nr:glycosyltransferase family 4 protein [Clostridiales bacterium]